MIEETRQGGSDGLSVTQVEVTQEMLNAGADVLMTLDLEAVGALEATALVLQAALEGRQHRKAKYSLVLPTELAGRLTTWRRNEKEVPG